MQIKGLAQAWHGVRAPSTAATLPLSWLEQRLLKSCKPGSYLVGEGLTGMSVCLSPPFPPSFPHWTSLGDPITSSCACLCF